VGALVEEIMMKKVKTKLALDKETVRSLAGAHLAMAQGGAPDPTRAICDTAGPACTSMGHTCAGTFCHC
jgi:hypothetical protein